MKIAITTVGDELAAEIDTRFGRAQRFILYDTEKQTFAVVENKQSLNAPQGAGIQAAQTIAQLGANVLISGQCGPKAFAVLQAAEIKVYQAQQGSVAEAIEAFAAGKLALAASPTVEGHWV